jgi:hypothetical protein
MNPASPPPSSHSAPAIVPPLSTSPSKGIRSTVCSSVICRIFFLAEGGGEGRISVAWPLGRIVECICVGERALTPERKVRTTARAAAASGVGGDIV